MNNIIKYNILFILNHLFKNISQKMSFVIYCFNVPNNDI